MADPCAGLTGVRRRICRGTEPGIAGETRLRYIAKWEAAGLLTADAANAIRSTPVHEINKDSAGIARTGYSQTQECNAQRTPKVQRKPRPAGPGTHLKRLLSELGIESIEGCGCNKRASQMDAWGVSGCREHRAEIVAWLDEQREKSGWWQQLTAGVKAVAAGLWLNPLDVSGSLVDEACRRAESEGESGPPLT